ncbi:hypothetical protein H9660_10290 [Clostridium sp. Sa3CUN1]|uniref:DUF5666 domain-containing protein n=1 Tax=Clostridium gallinarum TaxID=2762246 RepID=A0ABR8Q548_9CLOT|nr:hypothetical protein [Clostridium gallinarum]MBD7915536.1 hypothetical protein [Clostridium gallinarum]
MKFKKSLVLVCSVLTFSLFLIGAADPSKGMSSKSPVIMGEVIEVEKDESDKTIRITIEGYIKGNEINKIKVVGIVNDETKIMNSANDKKENINIEKGDLVYMRVSEAMTKSMPPQTVVKRLFITKNK